MEDEYRVVSRELETCLGVGWRSEGVRLECVESIDRSID